MRPELHSMLRDLPDGISEFTFANLYLFRDSHQYRVARLSSGLIILLGRDRQQPFFMLPFGLPDRQVLQNLFAVHETMKCVSSSQKPLLETMGFRVEEDRDNFDYLYHRANLSELAGRKFHKKRNLIKAFINNYAYEGKPLLEEYLPHALAVLEEWKAGRDNPGDYSAAREALEKSEELQLCGGIYYVEDRPVAYSLGEELACGTSFAIHFEKAVDGYKGIWQFVNQAFASIITEHYTYINREQDLGDDGLRQAKLSYKPSGFIKKYRAFSA